MKNIVKMIEDKKDLEINISKYANGMLSMYYRGALVRSIMNYYTYFQMLEDSSDSNEYTHQITEIVRMLFVKSENDGTEQIINKIDNIRNRNNSIVNELTIYADVFSLYEYVLNRYEYRFKEPEENLKNQSDEDITRQTMKYILGDKDNNIVNTRIKEVVTQIPVRMAKGRFFDYLHEALKIYKNTDIKSLDDYVYMIRSSAALGINLDSLTEFDDLSDIYKSFIKIDYNSIDEAEYDDLQEKLRYATDFINENTSKYVLLQDIINDIYIIALANQYILDKPNELDMYKTVVNKVGKMYNHELSDNDDNELMDIFQSLEGVQESIYDLCMKYDYLLDDILSSYSDIIESTMTKTLYNSLSLIRTLASGSSFVDIHENINNDDVTIEYIEKIYMKLVEEFTDEFSKDQKCMMRARMSVVLGEIPPIFNSIAEAQDYIYNSFYRCSDEAEKLACKEILCSMMTETQPD